MGRCYEFGITVHEGCEQAMVVPLECGKCVCPTCHAECLGQFEGCPAIISQPMYVPDSAPEWARPGGDGVPTASRRDMKRRRPPRSSPRQPTLATRVDLPTPTTIDEALARPSTAIDVVATLRPLLEATLNRPERAVEAIELLNEQMASRDIELAQTFTRLTEAYASLAQEVAADSEARLALTQAVRELADKVEALGGRSRLGLGFRSRSA